MRQRVLRFGGWALGTAIAVSWAWAQGSATIEAREFKELIGKTPQIQIVDVREKSEWDQAKFPKATHIPLGQLEKNFSLLDPNQPIVTVCHYGNRSARAAQFLKEKGFKDVRSLQGGIDAYSQTVDPSIPRY